jgi:antitoxin (DNA-binding transcriptional repressor) of toxin-antitoxin stability system
MKVIGMEKTTLEGCVNDAQRERVVITRDGKPVALVIGVEGMDEEQLHLGGSDKFWTFIEQRRKERTISRAELEQGIGSTN